MGTAQAGLFDDDEARKAILDLRQRVEQSNTAIKGLADENAQLRRALLDFQGQIEGLKTAIERSGEVGMCSFDQSIFALFERGEITQAEAFAPIYVRLAYSPT